MKQVEYTFCMKQFKPAVMVLAILVVIVLGWTGWHCTRGRLGNMHLALAAAITTPSASPIRVKDKMLHPYWGNCNKCHVTVDAGKVISKVMAGAPISVNDKMLHDYWGNCLLCHKVIDGLQPQKKTGPALAAAHQRLTARSLGLKVQTVTAATMQQFGLAREDGVLVLQVAPDSLAAGADLRQGDEIVRVAKARIETVQALDAALSTVKPGGRLKINIYRGKKSRNLLIKLPKRLLQDAVQAAATTPMTQNRIETLAEQLGVPKTRQSVEQALQHQQQSRAALTTPMTQNKVETLAEQMGVPKTRQSVARALQHQQQSRAAAFNNHGKVAVAANGPGLGYPVAGRFGASPYFVVFDPQSNNYRVAANPNANDVIGSAVQTGQYMVDLGVNNVVAGQIEPDALQTLHTLRVSAYSGVTGSVKDILSAYMAGDLMPVRLNPNLRGALPKPNPPTTGGGLNLRLNSQPM